LLTFHGNTFQALVNKTNTGTQSVWRYGGSGLLASAFAIWQLQFQHDGMLLGFWLSALTFISLFSSSSGLDDFQIPTHRQAAGRCESGCLTHSKIKKKNS
jgi:hypothetical protein